MCDFFWLSPADQGDLSDVVRASLQRLPAVATSAVAACSHESLGVHDLPDHEEEDRLLLQAVNYPGDDDHDEVQLHQQQLVHGDGMGVMVSNTSSSCDPLLLQANGLIRHVMSGPPPQPDAAGVIVEAGECGVGAPEMDEQSLDVAVDAHPHGPAIKRRKSQMKKVVCIPAPTAVPPGLGGRPSTSGEVVPSDLWAWRKYGQKPIKGSPYPRGYYRCSSSKGCSARKQVERSRTDPSMLVITYTSDHNHPWPTQRNALAGSTRPPAASSSSAAAKSHHHQHHSTAAAVPSRGANNIAGDSGTPISIGNDAHHQQQLPKQEVLDVMDHHRTEQQADVADHEVDMFADMDGALNILSASDFSSQKQLQPHATAADDDHHLEQDDKQKQQLLDPFSFFDWVDASFGIGDENKGGYT